MDMQNQQSTVFNFDATKTLDRLFGYLNPREKDVLKRRFGLDGADKATLEEIGKAHNLTRERVRQIEASGVVKIKKIHELDEIVADLKKAMDSLLAEYGGLLDKQYLLGILADLAKKNNQLDDPKAYANKLEFLLSKALDGDFLTVRQHQYFNEFVSSRKQTIDHLEEAAAELTKKIKETKKLFSTEDLIGVIKELEAFKKSAGKFQVDATAQAWPLKINQHEVAKLTFEHKPFYAFLQALKEVEQNIFGAWGEASSREIKPKTINDKIYLVLKKEGKPMHYHDIVKRINELNFDHKKINLATAHNELILDKKYVLVGRGIYGLKEWGYREGAVTDIVADVLKAGGAPMTKKEIVDQVNKQRIVKKNTINLALMNKNKFKKVGTKKYWFKD